MVQIHDGAFETVAFETTVAVLVQRQPGLVRTVGCAGTNDDVGRTGADSGGARSGLAVRVPDDRRRQRRRTADATSVARRTMILAASVPEDIFRAILQGTPPGAVYALIALGFVLTYKTSGVFNLAFGAQAYISAALFFQARRSGGGRLGPPWSCRCSWWRRSSGWCSKRLIFRHLRTAPAVAKLVVTIGLTVACPTCSSSSSASRPVAGQTPRASSPTGVGVLRPVQRLQLQPQRAGGPGCRGAGACRRWAPCSGSPPSGCRCGPVVESPRMTELAGIRADRVSAFAWALSSVFAGMAGVLIAPRSTPWRRPTSSTWSSSPSPRPRWGAGQPARALVGGLALGIFIALLNTFLPRWSADTRVAGGDPGEHRAGGALRRPVRRAGAVAGDPANARAADPLAGVDPPPPAPAAATRSRALTVATRVFALGFFGIVGLVIFFRADQSWLFVVTQAVILATIYLSITVITGFAGQISLCQGAFAADRRVHRVPAGRPLRHVGPGGRRHRRRVAAAVGALLSLPVLRLGGVWVAIATLAFAFFFDSVMVKLSWIGGGDTALLEGTRVPRPTIGPWDFANDLSFLGLAVVVFAWSSFAVIRIREGTVGRTLQALRGSEVAAASDRHLAGPGPDRRLRGVGVHRRLGGRDAVDAAGERELHQQLRPVHGPVLAGARRCIGLPHRGGGRRRRRLVRPVRRRDPPRRTARMDPAQPRSHPRYLPHLAQVAARALRPRHHPVRPPPRGPGRERQAPMDGPAAEAGRAPHRSLGRAPRASSAAPGRSWADAAETDGRAATVGAEECVMGTVLEATGVTKRFAGIVALDDVSLQVEAGRAGRADRPQRRRQDDVLQLRPGCGRPDGGQVLLDSGDIGGLPVHRRALLGIGRTFQRIELFTESTVREHLLIAERTRRGDGRLWKDLLGRGRPRPTRSPAATRCSSCSASTTSPTSRSSGLSLGKGRLVEVGRALMTDPKLLLLDEPSSGLDRDETADLARTLQEVQAEQGFAILLVEHDVELVPSFTERGYVLDFGCLIAGRDGRRWRAMRCVDFGDVEGGIVTGPEDPRRGPEATKATRRPMRTALRHPRWRRRPRSTGRRRGDRGVQDRRGCGSRGRSGGRRWHGDLGAAERVGGVRPVPLFGVSLSVGPGEAVALLGPTAPARPPWPGWRPAWWPPPAGR